MATSSFNHNIVIDDEKKAKRLLDILDCGESREMSIEEAIRILDPATTRDALDEIEYYAGFNGAEARITAVEEACNVACKIMRERIKENE